MDFIIYLFEHVLGAYCSREMSSVNIVSNNQEDDISTLRTSRLINCILNATCSFPAAFGNGIILIVIWRTPSLHSPSNTLLFGLALTDFLVGSVTQPLKVASSVIYLVSDEEGPVSLTLAFDVLSVVSSASSFFIATAISVDRYLVFYLHMRYQAIVTNKKVVVIIILCWFFSAFCGFIWTQNTTVYYLVGIASFLVSFTVIILMYYKIYRIVRRHQAQIQSQARVGIEQEASTQIRFTRITKSAINTFYVCFILFLCFSPYACVAIVVQFTGQSLTKFVALQYTGTITFINSALNPVVYFWRLPEMRRVIKRTFRCCFSQARVRHEEINSIELSGMGRKLAGSTCNDF